MTCVDCLHFKRYKVEVRQTRDKEVIWHCACELGCFATKHLRPKIFKMRPNYRGFQYVPSQLNRAEWCELYEGEDI